jgi:hypothetical protein
MACTVATPAAIIIRVIIRFIFTALFFVLLENSFHVFFRCFTPAVVRRWMLQIPAGAHSLDFPKASETDASRAEASTNGLPSAFHCSGRMSNR